MGTLWVLYGFTSDTMGTSDQWVAVWPCAVKWVTLWPLVNTRTAAPCCRDTQSGGDIVAFGSELNTRWKAPILPIIDSHIILVPHFSTYENPYFSLPLGKSTECPPMPHAELQQSAFLVWMLIAMMIPPLWRWRVRVDWWWLHHGPTIIIALAGHLVASHNTTGWPEIIITLLASVKPMGSGQVTWSLTTYGLSEWVHHGERTEGYPESIKGTEG